MDPFWNNIYDDVKDRRYGTLFLGTLFLGLPLLALVLGVAGGTFAELMDVLTGYPDINAFQFLFIILLAGLPVLTTVLLWRHWIRIERKTHRDRLKFSNLSRDELLKARSKLKGQMNPVKFRLVERPAKRAALRAPDTDLKY
ncbi:MAG TPA: hypothetical protein VGJ73_02435 [Verrucomicrobiae bacterium]|jgi:hypothetical protein